jgi:hypothetical protein
MALAMIGIFKFQRLGLFARQTERDIDLIGVDRHTPGTSAISSNP